ncbi:MAG TPA: phosphoglycolate phosphatase [Candidimonas sp.]|nr:phosphoglycolate phosphatase [Candidimonas sp.]
MQISAVLLDLDGTLLDTIPDLADAANAMRAEFGMPPLAQAIIATYVGKGTENLVARTLSAQAAQTALPAVALADGLRVFGDHYHRINGRSATLYPGVLQGLEAFKTMGVKLAVVTNKPTEFTLPLLAQCGIARYFQAVVCGDTCEHRKPHPLPLLHACRLLGVTPDQAIAIGDSVNDALAARAARIKVLAVPYGYNEGQDVRTLEVDDIVTSIDHAASWVAGHKKKFQKP